ncbi:growth hormone-regulated TBC protein 1 [Oryx dammah]|uniref:growth hormone-regulated TBC protein 1 n=1 Tax=Oryx dammah TaxID=59534 RepID=UPI001A9B8FA3|nr:growth hormone-regulated TBC protein 1 [Oryx dammah]
MTQLICPLAIRPASAGLGVLLGPGQALAPEPPTCRGWGIAGGQFQLVRDPCLDHQVVRAWLVDKVFTLQVGCVFYRRKTLETPGLKQPLRQRPVCEPHVCMRVLPKEKTLLPGSRAAFLLQVPRREQRCSGEYKFSIAYLSLGGRERLPCLHPSDAADLRVPADPRVPVTRPGTHGPRRPAPAPAGCPRVPVPESRAEVTGWRRRGLAGRATAGVRAAQLLIALGAGTLLPAADPARGQDGPLLECAVPGCWVSVCAGPCARGTLLWAFLCGRIDPYGFERPEDFDYAAYEEFFSAYLAILTRRAIKWSRLLKGGGAVQRSMTVKRYIRKGIPLEHRARVWMGVSGAQARMDRNPGYYQRLLQGERSASLEEAIRTDMNRTFPDNVRFRKDAEPCLQGPLYNVLLAYGHHNHGVGYCQGLNFVAGCLILVTESEEEAFWLLDALVGRILPADYYSPSMLGLKTDQEVLGELVRTKLPAVAALMDGHGVLWTLVASRWFICLFVDVLPVETVLRVWDCLFSEGSKIIFRVALTLLKHHQASILEATSAPDLCEKLKEITRGRFVTECHGFMQRVFSEPGSLSRASIARLRERCRAQLLAQG